MVHLQKPTDVKDVRIYFGTKNGDQLQAGTVEASVDGTVWKQLHVAGSVARAGGMAQSKPYADQVRYVDFEGDAARSQSSAPHGQFADWQQVVAFVRCASEHPVPSRTVCPGGGGRQRQGGIRK